MTSLAFSAAPVPDADNEVSKGAHLRRRLLRHSDEDENTRSENVQPRSPVLADSGPAEKERTEHTEPFSSSLAYGDANGRNDLANQSIDKYYSRALPRLMEEDSLEESNSKMDYMIHLLEESRNERTGHMTEELTLYCFLGVFIIFVLDTFSRKS